MNKSTKAQEYAAKEKKEYTIKVKTIVKVIIIIALMGSTYVLGWNNRSDFANEVKGEVRDQMSAIQAVKQNQ